MRELVFNIKQTFDEKGDDGALRQYGCDKFNIPVYQRGYKWGSEPNGAVSILLSDLKEAFEAHQNGVRKEYYLQYITVKRNDALNQLEVIDGQQRLTTLSIIFSVFSALFGQENLAYQKLRYSIRDNFFETHIYDKKELQNLLNLTWKEFIDKNPELNKQDVYYLFEAVQYVGGFLKKMEKERPEGFYQFLCEHVMLIVNAVGPHVKSETVFRNLNSNQVRLTETELIKGYLITKIGRNTDSKGHVHFREILELRANLGRKWDEMNAWCNRPDVRSFYFSRKDGMNELLRVTALMLNEKGPEEKGEYGLFNFYHSLDKTDYPYSLLKENFNKLQDWYNQDELYNLIGFCRFARGNKNNNLGFLATCLEKENSDDLKRYLEAAKLNLLPSEGAGKIKYGGEDDNLIHSTLLALSVFREERMTRFDYYQFEKEKWTLEHIFPQSPEGKKNKLTEKQRQHVIDMLGNQLSDKLNEILSKDERNEEEKKHYYQALKELTILDSVGNICLLSSSDNSSNGNLFFKEKRSNILKRLQQGSFVPKHTFDVFSKMVPGLEGKSLDTWTKEDIETHENYIDQVIKKLHK